MSGLDDDGAVPAPEPDDGVSDAVARHGVVDPPVQVLGESGPDVNASGAWGVQMGNSPVQHNYYGPVVVGPGLAAPVAAPDRSKVRMRAGVCPYPGMTPFQAADAPYFHGREGLTEDLLAQVGQVCVNGGLLFVVGPSGSGKSSLLRAGLVPALQAERLEVAGMSGWPRLLLPADPQPVLTPGPQPAEALATCVANLAGLPVGGVLRDLVADPDQFHLLVRQALQAHQADRSPDAGAAEDHVVGGSRQQVGGSQMARRLVLIVDQFEEIFAPHVGEEARRVFVRALLSAAAPQIPVSSLGPAHPDADAAAIVVLGMRADFFTHCVSDPLLCQHLQHHQVLVGPLTEGEFRSAIEQPAEDVGLTLEPGLIEILLTDLGLRPTCDDNQGSAAGRLPFLAHALRETWERRTVDDMLTIDAYRATGGVHTSVAASAERLYNALDDQHQKVLRQTMLRLITITEDAPLTRRHLTHDEVASAQAPAQAGVVADVVDHLVAARLVTSTDGWIEISHEALIGAWSRLTGWLEEDPAGLYLHRHLTKAAAEWDRLHRDEGSLYRGIRLAAARDWVAQPGHRADLNDLERQFLDASIRADEERALAEEELRSARRIAREYEKREEERKEAERAEEEERSASVDHWLKFMSVWGDFP
jgi:energy-coupling factor transporter ATP-binding protein EcfA2